MKRVALFSLTVLIAAALFAGAASADPLKNYRLLVPATCDGGSAEDEEFEFVINGEGVAGHILGSTSNIMPVQDTATYTYKDPETGEIVEEEVVDQLGQYLKNPKNKNGLRDDLETCEGSVEYEDPELGTVRVEFEIQAFFTPRGK